MPGTARHENDLGSQITVDSGDIPAATGWTITEGTVNRIGPEVMVHVEVENDAGAAALVMTLPQDYWPDHDVHTENGLFVIEADDGTVSYTGDTTVATSGINAVHRVATSGVPTGGSASVTYAGKAPITVPRNCSQSALQTLLDGIFGAGNTLVGGGPLPTALTITFQGALAHTVQAAPAVDDSGLTGGTTPHLTVVSTTTGVVPVPFVCEAVFDPFRSH